MYRNTILGICLGVCVVAVAAGLFIVYLSSAGRPVALTQQTPSAASPVPAATTAGLAVVPTTAALATAAPASAPSATGVPTSAPPATEAPTAAPTSAPVPPTEVPTAAPTIAPPTAAPAVEFVEYTVQRGDELLQLAKKYNVSAKEILDNNEIANPDSLVVGQVLRIPKK